MPSRSPRQIPRSGARLQRQGWSETESPTNSGNRSGDSAGTASSRAAVFTRRPAKSACNAPASNSGNRPGGRHPLVRSRCQGAGHRWKDDLCVGGIHPIAADIGIPCDEVAARHAPHYLVRARHNACEGGAGLLAVAGGQVGVEDERVTSRRELGDLAEQASAVHPADAVQRLAQLTTAKVCMVCLVCHRHARLARRPNDPPPGQSRQLLLGFRLEFDPRHLNVLVQTCN